MPKEQSNIKPLITALTLIAAPLAIIYAFIASLINKLATLQGDLSKTLVASSATIIISVITIVIGKAWEHKLKTREEIRSKKIPVYEKQIETFFSVFMSDKTTGKKINDRDLTKAFIAFSEKLLIWGSSDVIQAWVKFRTAKHQGDESIKLMNELFIAIRKDLGNDSSKLSNHELLRLFINDLDKDGNLIQNNQSKTK